MTDIHNNAVSAYSDNKSEKKMFRQLFFRQFQLLGSMNFTRMEGLSYGWAIAPMLKKSMLATRIAIPSRSNVTASSSIPTSI